MHLVVVLAEVVIGSLVLFGIARLALPRLVPQRGWLWVALVGVLAIANMLVHRLLGSSINPPVWTAVLFGIPVAGLAGAEPWSRPWPKRAVYAILAGTILGWFFYAEVVTTP